LMRAWHRFLGAVALRPCRLQGGRRKIEATTAEILIQA
jgi:hypothetical protein